jgi:hypothetical protein
MLKTNFRILIWLIVLLSLIGCVATLPPKAEISKSYSLTGVKTYVIKTDCKNTNSSDIKPSFIATYCQVLDGNIKVAIQRTNPEFQYSDKESDITIETVLEEMHGGSAAARFLIGFGAGRSVTTVYVRIYKRETLMAERRITETTTMPNLATKTYENEDAILQDAPLLARKIAEFIADPVKYKEENPY